MVAGSTARTISTPICRRATRSASSITRWWARVARDRRSTTRTPEGEKTIGIERIHVEQDAGKLMHDQHPTMSYVDLNRSGVALMEIVSPSRTCARLRGGGLSEEAGPILRYVGSCDGNMEQGSMRADVNVSVRKPGEEFGTRTETKNVNSVRFVHGRSSNMRRAARSM
jgi:Asp-tRNA(Asn)/Glu-tRNA(Gln) amidotransferase B subunit